MALMRESPARTASEGLWDPRPSYQSARDSPGRFSQDCTRELRRVQGGGAGLCPLLIPHKRENKRRAPVREPAPPFHLSPIPSRIPLPRSLSPLSSHLSPLPFLHLLALLEQPGPVRGGGGSEAPKELLDLRPVALDDLEEPLLDHGGLDLNAR